MLDIQKAWIKNFEVCLERLHFNTIDQQIMFDGQQFNFFTKKFPIVVIVFLQQVYHNKYW